MVTCKTDFLSLELVSLSLHQEIIYTCDVIWLIGYHPFMTLRHRRFWLIGHHPVMALDHDHAATASAEANQKLST